MIRFLNRGTKRGEIWLYEDVGEGFFSGGMSAKRFAEELNKLGQIDVLNLHINSAGGNVFDGLAIYNTLERHPARLVVDVDGLAASIASIIAMAGDEIRIASNALMMIHNPRGFAHGDSEDMRKTAELLDQVKGNLVDTYERRTKQKPNDISAAMEKETWFTSGEAVQFGLADSVTEALQVAAHFDLSSFKNPPRVLAQQATRPARDIAAVRSARQSQRLAVQAA